MTKVLRWSGIAFGVLIVVALLGFAYIYFASSRVLGRTHDAALETLPQPSAAMLADAGRQARVLGCRNCHGDGLEGKLMFEAPGVGQVFASNLTEVAATATDQQLAAAIRQGIGTDGRPLFVMPSAPYSRLTDEEVAALIAYIRAQPRSAAANGKVSWGPLGRIGIVRGKLKPQTAHVEDYRLRSPVDLGPGHAAGRHIAATMCSGCHQADLEGGVMEDGANAPDLTVAGAYSLEEFRTLLRTGVATGGREVGLMSEIARADTAHMTDAEIRALYEYLKARAERVSL